MSQVPLQQRAYDEIHQLIVSGRLAKGSVTSEVYLSKLLDMSRTPIRSALQRLELEGCLRTIAKHGVLILETSAQKAGELIDVINALVQFSIIRLLRVDPETIAEYCRQQLEMLEEIWIQKDISNLEHILCKFEYDLCIGVFRLNHHQEMENLFATTATRLYWFSNTRRWRQPSISETVLLVRSLLRIPTLVDASPFRVLHLLFQQQYKLTWI